MRRRFDELLQAHAQATSGGISQADDDAADQLPLGQDLEEFRWLDSEHQHAWIAKAWASSVENTARELEELLAAHDNRGTVATTATIKAAARDLLFLLGKDRSS